MADKKDTVKGYKNIMNLTGRDYQKPVHSGCLDVPGLWTDSEGLTELVFG